MSDFFTWCMSLPTGQLLLNGRHGAVVRELRLRWETKRILEALAPHRERLAKITKRAVRAMKGWSHRLQSGVYACMGQKPKVNAVEATESLLKRVAEISGELLAYPPQAPVPQFDRALYWEVTRGASRAVRAELSRALRNLPPAVIELLTEQSRNPWLAGHIVGLFMAPPRETATLEGWLQAWCRRAKMTYSAKAVADWRRCLNGAARVAPAEIESLIAYRLGLMIEGLSSTSQEVPRLHGAMPASSDAAPSCATPAVQRPNESRMYSIREASKEFNLKPWTIRSAVAQGALKCSRPTDAPNAPIMLRDVDIRDWRADQVGKRRHAPRSATLDV